MSNKKCRNEGLLLMGFIVLLVYSMFIRQELIGIIIYLILSGVLLHAYWSCKKQA